MAERGGRAQDEAPGHIASQELGSAKEAAGTGQTAGKSGRRDLRLHRAGRVGDGVRTDTDRERL